MRVENLPLLTAIKHLSQTIDELVARITNLEGSIEDLQHVEYEPSDSSDTTEEEESDETDTCSLHSAPATFSYKRQRTDAGA